MNALLKLPNINVFTAEWGGLSTWSRPTGHLIMSFLIINRLKIPECCTQSFLIVIMDILRHTSSSFHVLNK